MAFNLFGALADHGSSRDDTRKNLLYGVGIMPKAKKFTPRSIATSEAFLRCEEAIPDFTSDQRELCESMANRRNAELHGGGLPFHQLKPSTWLPRFHKTAQILAESQHHTLEEFVGLDYHATALKMIAAHDDEAAKQVGKLVAAHTAVWNAKSNGERADLASAAENSAATHLGHDVKCPACGSKALLTGEVAKQLPATFDGEMVLERQEILPTRLKCDACSLVIDGHSKLHAVERGDVFTAQSWYDPIQLYAPDYPGGEASCGDYNND